MLIGGFQPFTLTDYPGKTAAIVFTQGCNFCCPYCHNRSLWPVAPVDRQPHMTETALGHLAHRKGLLGGVVVTGGEPTLQPDLPGFLSKIKRMGYAVKLDTNGSRPEVIAALTTDGLIDHIAMDIKAPLEKYAQLCGLPVDTDAIRRSIDLIASCGLPHLFRTTFYPHLLDEDDLTAVKHLVPPQSLHVTQAYREPSDHTPDALAQPDSISY